MHALTDYIRYYDNALPTEFCRQGVVVIPDVVSQCVHGETLSLRSPIDQLSAQASARWVPHARHIAAIDQRPRS